MKQSFYVLAAFILGFLIACVSNDSRPKAQSHGQGIPDISIQGFQDFEFGHNSVRVYQWMDRSGRVYLAIPEHSYGGASITR